MKETYTMTRRSALTTIAAGSGVVLRTAQAETQPNPANPAKGRLKQGVSRWCFGRIKLDELTREAKAMGISGIDLLGAED